MAEEPQVDERNEEREQLLAALEAADTPPGEETPKSEELASDASESEETADTPDPEPEAKAEVTEETSEPTEKPVSNREKKSEERLGKGWDKLNEEKAELKRQREEFEAQKQQRSDDETSPEEYRELAERYREDGETDLAELAEQKAKEVEGRREQQRHQDVADGIRSQWNENLKDLQAQYPDLEKPDTEMSRGVEHVLEQRPYLKGYPEGIQDAVEFVNSKIASKKVESLEKTNGDLKAEIDELKKQTSVTGSPPARESAPQGPNEGSQEQVRDKLMDALRAADEAGSGMRIFR